MNNVVCPGCGRATAKSELLSTYDYRQSGLDGVILHGGVTKLTCPCDPEPYFGVEKEVQLLQVIALGLLMKPAPLTGPEQRFLRAECRLTQAELARLLKGTRRETIAERERRSAKPLSPAEDFWFRVVIVQEFHELLLQPGQSHLTAQQFRQLVGFRESLSTFARAIEAKAKKKPMQLSLSKGRPWTIDHAA